MPRYKVKTGINYPPGKRAEIGDVVDNLPEQSVPWLLAEGHIEEEGQESVPVSEPDNKAPATESAPAQTLTDTESSKGGET